MSLNVNRRVPYGELVGFCGLCRNVVDEDCITTKPVRLGKSGLKVSRIILGCMSYGTPEWLPWVLGEEEGIAQIKFACVYLFSKSRAARLAYFSQAPCLY